MKTMKNRKFDLQLFAEETTDAQNQATTSAQADTTQQAATQTADTAAAVANNGQAADLSASRIQQIEGLTKEEIQARLQSLKDEETTLLEAAKKFEEEEKAKLVAYAKDHGLEVGLLLIVLARIFGVI